MDAMVETAHTAQLAPETLQAAEALLGEVFEGELTPSDFEHALGGVHALVWDDETLVAHGAVVMRRLLHGGRALRAGYVEGVGVRPSARRRGHGAAVMRALAGVIERAYDLGALGATDEAIPLYERLGWRRWAGPLYALTPDGLRRTADEDGAVFVLETAVPLDLAGELACDWRDGDVW
jgi:aminoglycoside 2'-N-acetyltransferase I